MFQKAYAIARSFTWPVVLSRRTHQGACSSSIGTFVLVNEQGWIVTAWHILEQWQQLEQEAKEWKERDSLEQEIRNNQALTQKERQKKLQKLGKWGPDATSRCSAWWGRDGITLTKYGGIPAIDIGFGKLEPFDPGWVQQYPTFKDPDRDFEPGRSLCRLGFPFHAIQPVWDDERQCFHLPPEAVPLPLFPIEGIFTRTCVLVSPNGQAVPKYPLQFVETSSPGLRGQSGGPIFDVNGVLWAIQSRTAHCPLGFDPEVPGNPGRREHQFINVGLGIHTATILGLFK
jgi:hypothetical protein